MLQHSHKFAVAIMIVVVYMVTLVGQGFAQDSGIKLVMNPSKTDVYLGSDPIALTARVKGKNLSYAWKLLGPGKLEGKGSSVFYILPETIEGESEQALITVTVTDESGEEMTESVTFNILAEEKTAAKGMSTTTKIALGAVAIIGLGGGATLTLSGDGDDDGDGEATYDIVGEWLYRLDDPEYNAVAEGRIIFTGSKTSGDFNQRDDANSETYTGRYTVEGINVTIEGSVFIMTGAFTTETRMDGTWYRVDNSEVKGTWWICKAGQCE
jgi:hypothetical protein